MGSKSDWETMQAASEMLTEFGVSHECRVVSAHRTPQWMCEYAQSAEQRGLEIIIAGAGGAAHLPGMIASQTVLPVLGVPVQSKAPKGLDSGGPPPRSRHQSVRRDATPRCAAVGLHCRPRGARSRTWPRNHGSLATCGNKAGGIRTYPGRRSTTNVVSLCHGLGALAGNAVKHL